MLPESELEKLREYSTGDRPGSPSSSLLADVISEIEELRAITRGLVRGIEDWASQEDGIPDDLWETYARAKAVLGEPINHDPEA